MGFRIEFVRSAANEFAKLDRTAQVRILRYLRQRVAGGDDPRRFGRALHGELGGLWRYRVGAWRVICRIDHAEERILVLRVTHRRHAYD